MRPSGRFLNRFDLLGITFSSAFFYNDTQSLIKVIATLIGTKYFLPSNAEATNAL
jgi:hypothetical protein